MSCQFDAILLLLQEIKQFDAILQFIARNKTI